MSLLRPFYAKLQPQAANMNLETARGNVAISTQLGLEEFLTEMAINAYGQLTLDNFTIAIVNPGPSATTPEALAELNSGSANGKSLYIVLAGTGYNMLDRGLDVAHALVLHHPDSKFVEAMPKLGDDTSLEYVVSSMAPAGYDPENPSVFDVLSSKGCNVKIWHAHIEGGPEFDEDKLTIGTGSGAPVAAMALYNAMGFRNFRIYGMDGSSEYAVDLGNSKAMEDYLAGLEANQMAVRIGDKVFTVAKAFWSQTQEIIEFLQDYPDVIDSLHFTGNTANAAIFNTPDGKPNLDIEILPQPVTSTPTPEHKL